MGSLLDAASGAQSNADGNQGSQSGNESSQQNSSQPNVSDWKSKLPEDIRGEKIWEKYKDEGSVYKSLVHLEKKLGSAINIPGPDAKPEEIAAFREKLGVPKDVTGYKNEIKLPGDAQWDEGALGNFNGVAHKLGLTQAQYQGILEYYGTQVGSIDEINKKTLDEGSKALKEKWGAEYDNRLKEAGAALAAYDNGGAVKQLLFEAGLANHPAIVEFMQRVGSEVGEDRVVNGEKPKAMDKEAAEQKIKEIQGTPDHPLYNKKHPSHGDAVKEYAELLKIATA